MYVGARSKVLNISKSKALLANYSDRNLKSGIHEVIDWFEKTKSFH
jgi:hypothetical protein